MHTDSAARVWVISTATSSEGRSTRYSATASDTRKNASELAMAMRLML
jgi:hypothetical protein